MKKGETMFDFFNTRMSVRDNVFLKAELKVVASFGSKSFKDVVQGIADPVREQVTGQGLLMIYENFNE